MGTKGNKTTIIEKLLPYSGKTAKIDISKATGRVLFKARKFANGDNYAVELFILSEISTFDDEKIPAPEIENFHALDIISLEEAWNSIATKKS